MSSLHKPVSNRASFLPTGSREATLKLASFYSSLIKVIDDPCAAKPHGGPFQVPILFDRSASPDRAHPSLILEMLSPSLFGFLGATLLVLTYFTDHSLVSSAGSASEPHPLSFGGPQDSVHLHTFPE